MKRKLPRDGAGGWLTEGRAALVQHLAQKGASQTALAARLGCTRSMVCMIASGQRIPTAYPLVSALHRELLIDPAAWTRPLASNVTTVNKNDARVTTVTRH